MLEKGRTNGFSLLVKVTGQVNFRGYIPRCQRWSVDLLHVRLREELERLGLKAVAAARLAGESDSQGLRDVLGGRKRLSADLLAALVVTCRVDGTYVLTGRRDSLSKPALSIEEQLLLERFSKATPKLQNAALRVLLDDEGDIRGSVTNIEGSQQVFHQAPSGHVAGGDLIMGSSTNIAGRDVNKK